MYYIGSILGGFILPRMSDKYGRYWMLIVQQLSCMLAFFGIYFSTSYGMLLNAYLLWGITLSVRLPVGVAFMYESMPRANYEVAESSVLLLDFTASIVIYLMALSGS